MLPKSRRAVVITVSNHSPSSKGRQEPSKGLVTKLGSNKNIDLRWLKADRYNAEMVILAALNCGCTIIELADPLWKISELDKLLSLADRRGICVVMASDNAEQYRILNLRGAPGVRKV